MALNGKENETVGRYVANNTNVPTFGMTSQKRQDVDAAVARLREANTKR